MRERLPRCAAVAFCCVLLLLSSCISYQPEPLLDWPNPGSVQALTHNNIMVSAGILSDEQAEQVYGVDLATVGLQAVWLRIENHNDHSYWLMVSALDPNYFAPDEAAVLFYPVTVGKDEDRLTQHFRELAIPLKTEGGAVTEGYVLTPRHEGGRYLTVSLIGRHHATDFGFAITLPGGDFDFDRLNPAQTYAGLERPDLDLQQLRDALRKLPCCAANDEGVESGDPLNLVMIGDSDDVLASLSRGGWSFTQVINFQTVRRMIGAAISGASYPVAPVSPLYFMGRPHDLALQRARNTILQRNHLRLWLAPFQFQGKSVWVGQVSRDISIKPTMSSPNLVTHVIDPNVDEAREHVLQSLLVAGVVTRFGFVAGIEPATAANPHFNLSEDPYFTDGLRLVMLLSGKTTTSPDKVGFIDWQKSMDPLVQ
jgi:LssY C-terminus